MYISTSLFSRSKFITCALRFYPHERIYLFAKHYNTNFAFLQLVRVTFSRLVRYDQPFQPLFQWYLYIIRYVLPRKARKNLSWLGRQKRFLSWCGRQDLNLHGIPPVPKTGASTIPPRPLDTNRLSCERYYNKKKRLCQEKNKFFLKIEKISEDRLRSPEKYPVKISLTSVCFSLRSE